MNDPVEIEREPLPYVEVPYEIDLDAVTFIYKGERIPGPDFARRIGLEPAVEIPLGEDGPRVQAPAPPPASPPP